MRERVSIPTKLFAAATLGIALMGCGGAESDNQGISIESVPLPTPTVVKPIVEKTPTIDKSMQILGSSVRCTNEDSNSKTEEGYLYLNQEANIKGLVVRSIVAGQIFPMRGGEGGPPEITYDEKGRQIMDITIPGVKARITAEKVAPNNSEPGTYLLARFECTDIVGPKN